MIPPLTEQQKRTIHDGHWLRAMQEICIGNEIPLSVGHRIVEEYRKGL